MPDSLSQPFCANAPPVTNVPEVPDAMALVETVAGRLMDLLAARRIAREQIEMLGIRTGGVWVAEQLRQRLQLTQPLGALDISFYRDDFHQHGLHPNVRPSHLSVTSVEGRTIVLVDDVLMTGRTIRAALNEVFDYGRPVAVILVTLLDVNARELPIRPDVVGAQLILPAEHRIKLVGPDPLHFVWESHVSAKSEHNNG